MKNERIGKNESSFYSGNLKNAYVRKKLIINQSYVNNALIEIKNHVFRYSALKKVEGSLSYGKSTSAIWFLKA